MNPFLKKAEELFPYTQAMRRDFHKHPELGFNEIRTGGIVAKELEALGIEVTKGVGKTGVVGYLEGTKPGPTILLRFDMDALPIAEDTGAEYSSENAGVMHACGHDGHTAIGLTVAKILNERKHELAGNIKFCFQPSEEGTNGEEIGGALMMMRDGVLEGPNVDKTLSLHLWNDKPLGWVHVAKGPVMAGADLFSVKLTGKGGHGAAPETTIDPIVCAAQIVTAIQSIVARNIEPLKPAVISVTTIHSGTAFNIIPQTAELGGTIRTFDLDVRKLVHARLEQIIRSTAAAMGCEVELLIKQVTAPVINNEGVAASVFESAQTLFPDTEITSNQYLTMGAEDMGYMQEKVDGCYFFIGSANAEKNLNYNHHHPKFDFDERALVSGVALMASAAADLLKG
ncbi:MAG: amidohydrolase [Anaerolineales bacterium]|uniref:M20 metallopeptidase family protein n=1 Tax=Candidatus Villigracilis vicinus TaxID=3140679 RepID=UPI003136B279|nr:amidohydrolase [Anaerolineales bacterium]